MNRSALTAFFVGLAISTLIVGIIWLCFLFLTFDLGGGETLSQIEDQNVAQLIISILLLTVAVIYALRYIKRNKRYTAYGIVIIPLAAVFAATFYFWKCNCYNTKFDKAIWIQAGWKPAKMAKTLVKEKALIGLTRAQIKHILGEGTEEYGDKNTDRGSIIHEVEEGWTLSIIFQYDKVVKPELRLPWLGI